MLFPAGIGIGPFDKGLFFGFFYSNDSGAFNAFVLTDPFFPSIGYSCCLGGILQPYQVIPVDIAVDDIQALTTQIDTNGINYLSNVFHPAGRDILLGRARVSEYEGKVVLFNSLYVNREMKFWFVGYIVLRVFRRLVV